MTRSLRLSTSARTGRVHAAFVARQLRRAARILRSPLRELTVVFVNDRRMRELHGRFMRLPTTTDVLTFPIDEDRRGRVISGEVYVCVAEARRQAKLRGIAVERELLLYALHGLLHLCGFDDRTGSEYRRMHRREDQLLTRLGIGPVFAPPAAGNPVPSASSDAPSVPATGRRRRRRRRTATRRKSG